MGEMRPTTRPLALLLSAASLAATYPAARLALSLLPGDARAELATSPDLALSLHPRFTAARLSRALSAELAGDLAAAERDLLTACEFDRRAKPLYSLAAFYARHERTSDFRSTAARLAALPGADLRGLFAIALRTGDGDAIGPMLPARPEPRRDWLIATMAGGRLDLARGAAEALASVSRPTGDWRAALAFCDRAIQAGDRDAALSVWRMLAARRLIAAPAPTLERPLTNGGFDHLPAGHGFDWRIHEPAGVLHSVSRRALRFEFDGAQSEHVDLAEQWMPLAPGGRYSLRWRTQGDSAGIAIVLPTGAAIPAGEAQTTFIATLPVARIVIRYDRPPGARRHDGQLTFSAFEMERSTP